MSRRHKSNDKIIVALVVIVLAVAAWPIALALGVFYLIFKLCKSNSKSKSKPRDNCYKYSEPKSYSDLYRQTNTQTQTHKPGTEAQYSSKSAFMTDCEKEFFVAFTEIVGDKYIIQPQINLASIVNKDTYSKYRNELFRNIDFGVFDKDYKLRFLIEINDKTHEQKDRQERDKNVKNICNEAGIPLVTFWTKYGVNKSYIKSVFTTHLPDLPVPTASPQPSQPSHSNIYNTEPPKKEPQNADQDTE